MNIPPLNCPPAGRRPQAGPAAPDQLRTPRGLLLLLALLTMPSNGCLYLYKWNILHAEVPKLAEGNYTLKAEGLVQVKAPEPNSADAKLAGAHEFFRTKEYTKAELLFHLLADDGKVDEKVRTEARYFEAECLRLQGLYPKAGDTYKRLLDDFPSNPYKEQACQRLYDIANYWLDDTREEMRETREMREGKRYFVWPRFVSFEKPKPLVDREGRAVQLLDAIHGHDTGLLRDKALFLAGSVKFFNQNYKEADEYFSLIVNKTGKPSPLAATALEYAIISKQLSTGGSDYDAMQVAEARKQVDMAFRNFPELARNKAEFLESQLKTITAQQADKDWKIAEYYRYTKHPGAAYFYYSMVERRYRGTPYAVQAAECMKQLRAEVEEEQRKAQEAVNPMQPKKSVWWWPFSSGNDKPGPAPGPGPGPSPAPTNNLPGGPEVAPAPRPAT